MRSHHALSDSLAGLLASFLLALAPTAALSATVTATPRIAFASTAYDFGKSSSGELVRHDFVFTNTGTATLEITEVRPGCGCTAAGAWDKLVLPGKTGRIPLQFNSTGFSGGVSKSATVTCNDPEQASITLQIMGTIWRPIEVTPTMASFVYASDGQTNQTQALHIVNNADEPLTLSEVQCSNKLFKAEIKTVRPGKEFELLVTAIPPFVTPSVFAAITVKTSLAKAPVLNLSAYVTVQAAVMLIPEQLVLPPGPLTNDVMLSVTVRNNGSNALTLSDLRLDIPGAKVALEEMQPGRLFAVRATFPVGFQLKAAQKVDLTVKSDHPRFSLLKVPIYQSAPVTASATASQVPKLDRRHITTNTESVVRVVPTRSARAPDPAGKH